MRGRDPWIDVVPKAFLRTVTQRTLQLQAIHGGRRVKGTCGGAWVGVFHALAGCDESVVECQCWRIEVVQFLRVGPVNPLLILSKCSI